MITPQEALASPDTRALEAMTDCHASGHTPEICDRCMAHGTLLPGDRHHPWSRGPTERRRITRRMARTRRHQLDREARQLGYIELGGEA